MNKTLTIWIIFSLCFNIQTGWAQNRAFIQNVGQITDTELRHRGDIDFKVSGQQGLQVFVGKGGLHYQWIDAEPQEDSTIQYSSYRLDMQLQGANPNAQRITGKQQATYERYFLSWVNTDNSNEGKVAHRYESVTYKDIYPKIDWKLYFTSEGHLEYDFIVHSGGQVSDIQLVYKGADSLKLTPNGRLQIHTPKGVIEERTPYSYEAKSKRQINSSFALNGNTVTFQTAAYTGTLVIDPVIEWGTYFGDVAADAANGITVDSIGNVYMVGTSNSINNISTQGAHQQSFGGGSALYGADGIITKWTPSGMLIWATYYGGTSKDILKYIRLDEYENLYIVGYTQSISGIATPNSFQVAKAGNSITHDVCLIKFDTAGNRKWGTYFGGTMEDGHLGLGLDVGNNQIYITGNTQSNNIYISPNAYKSIRQLTDAFITTFDTSGQVLISTYWGGPGTDVPTCIKIQNNTLYIAGYTESTTGIAINSSYQSMLNGVVDGFVCALDTVFNPIWSTYIGGNGEEKIWSLDANDSIIVMGGYTTSFDSISNVGSHQNSIGGNVDGYIGALNKNGQLLWGSYYGGTENDEIKSLIIGNTNQIYLLMETYSDNNISTPFSIKQTLDNTIDLAVLKFNLSGIRIWGTYMGGVNIETGQQIGLSDFHTVILAGGTNSGNNIATGNTHQTLLSGDYDAFLIKINDCDAPINTSAIQGLDTLCANTLSVYSIKVLSDASVYHWMTPSGWQGASDSNIISLVVGDTGGTIRVWVESACGGVSDTVQFDVYVHVIPDVKIIQQNSTLRSAFSFSGYQWLLNGQPIPDATKSTYLPTTNGRYSLLITTADGCTHTSDETEITTVNIRELLKNATIQVYPNPAKEVLTIKVSETMDVSITNSIGRLMSQHKLTSGYNDLAVRQLPAGAYILRFSNYKETQQTIFIKE